MTQPITEPATHLAPSPQATTRDVPAATPQRRRRFQVMLALAVLGLAAFGFYLYVPSLYEVSTDDAYLDAHVVSVVPKIAAYVEKLHIDDNSEVPEGGLMVELDPRDFAVAVQSAEADLASAEANVRNLTAQITEQQAVIAKNEATVAGDVSTLEFAREQLQRYGSLAKTGFGTTERWQQAQSDIGEREAGLKRDVAALNAARAHVGVLDTARQQADALISRQKAALAQARLNLSYTRITATVPGKVTNKSVEVGNFVQPGQVLLSLVPTQLYVTANFKETQLAHIRTGQTAEIRIDAFPNVRLKGHVDSTQAGTGSQFALLPPENATGNFVKVVQRVPVKIVLDDPGHFAALIAPGMSVEATVVFAPPPGWLAGITGWLG